MLEKTIFNAAIYVRLSKDDGDKAESNSIVNQKELIKDYVKSMPDIRICSIRVDDGYSGVDFLRPDFTKMMEDIKLGTINCVIVKDFSRFGRNYIEVGRYLENLFPFLGVRFISVNDRYDSFAKKNSADDIIIPFKNLINDMYCRDISVKVRSQLEIKRKSGEYIGPIAVYGYVKSPENKNKLIIDPYSAQVVRNMFLWKLEGMTQQKIADRLNEMGEFSPLEYKLMRGLKCSTSFRKGDRARWSVVSVSRVLKNPIYVGTLVQGKITTPNHKVKKKIVKPKEEWAVVKNTHEAIISKEIFTRVNQLLAQDTRLGVGERTVFKFAGLIFCGDCKNSMSRKTIKRADKKYIYYVCSTKKSGRGCSFHSFSEIELEKVVLNAIQMQINALLDIEKMLLYINALSPQQQQSVKVNSSIAMQEKNIQKYKKLKQQAYEDFKDGVLDTEDYETFLASYSEKIMEAKSSKNALADELDLVLKKDYSPNQIIDYFKAYHNIETLTRKTVVSLIEKIEIFQNNRVEITFLYSDKIMLLKQSLNKVDYESIAKKVV